MIGNTMCDKCHAIIKVYDRFSHASSYMHEIENTGKCDNCGNIMSYSEARKYYELVMAQS